MFSLNSVTEYLSLQKKGSYPCQPATSCVRDQDATTVPAWHMWETGSLNWAQFMLQWLSDSLNSPNLVKVTLHLGKTPMCWCVVPNTGIHSTRMQAKIFISFELHGCRHVNWNMLLLTIWKGCWGRIWMQSVQIPMSPLQWLFIDVTHSRVLKN